MSAAQVGVAAAAAAGGAYVAAKTATGRALRCVQRCDFDEAAAPEPPDYDRMEMWSAHPRSAPGRAVEDPNHMLTPDGAAPPPHDVRDADVFFIHDTTYNPAELAPFLAEPVPRWNAPVHAADGVVGALAAKINEQADLRVAVGAAPFSQRCRIYAPRYRQVMVMAFFHQIGVPLIASRVAEACKAMDLAYGDVRRAFQHFLRNRDSSRPFFIAAHSQGVIHSVRLLQDEIEGNPQRLSTFVHAYLAGMTVPLNLFGDTLKDVRISTCATDTRSVSSWRTGRAGHLVTVGAGSRTYYRGKGWVRSPLAVISTNPVTWTQGKGEKSQPDAHLGAAYLKLSEHPKDSAGWLPSGVALRFGALTASRQGPLGVRASAMEHVDCGRVTARVDGWQVTRVPRMPKKSLFAMTETDYLLYHDIDIALFYGNVAANVGERLKAWVGGPGAKL